MLAIIDVLYYRMSDKIRDNMVINGFLLIISANLQSLLISIVNSLDKTYFNKLSLRFGLLFENYNVVAEFKGKNSPNNRFSYGIL